MQVSVNSLLFICGVGILQAALLACIIQFHPKADRSVNKFLALYILCFCIPMFTPIIQVFFSWQYMILLDPFPLLSGPLLYFYVRSFKEEITWRKAWPHLVLFVIYVFIDVGLCFQLLQKYSPSHIVPADLVQQPTSILRVSVRLMQMIAYFFLAGRQLIIYQRAIQHLFSETSRINLAWVRWLVNGYLFLVLVMIGLYFLILQFPEQFGLFILINTAAVTPYLYLFTFKGITQPTLWQMPGLDKETIHIEMHQAEAMKTKEESRNLKSNVDPEKLGDIVQRTIALMKNEKLYLKTDLTLQDLADQLGTAPYLVSQAINEGLKKTFYDLVNGYRVEEAKRLLLNPQTRNNKMLALGFDAGFNSKTTFNTVFKKFTGLTPTDYREQQLQELVQL
jgi:AraC-like DNA-binding protein